MLTSGSIQDAAVHPAAVIGNNVKIQNNVSVYDAVTLEDNVFCGPSCVFTNIINPRCEYPRNTARFYKKTLVKKGATIGANATIVCGVTTGCYALVGAGAAVTKDVVGHVLAVRQSRLHEFRYVCGEKIRFKEQRGKRGVSARTYKKVGNKVSLVKR